MDMITYLKLQQDHNQGQYQIKMAAQGRICKRFKKMKMMGKILINKKKKKKELLTQKKKSSHTKK
jgi:hypothetical protein